MVRFYPYPTPLFFNPLTNFLVIIYQVPANGSLIIASTCPVDGGDSNLQNKIN